MKKSVLFFMSLLIVAMFLLAGCGGTKAVAGKAVAVYCDSDVLCQEELGESWVCENEQCVDTSPRERVFCGSNEECYDRLGEDYSCVNEVCITEDELIPCFDDSQCFETLGEEYMCLDEQCVVREEQVPVSNPPAQGSSLKQVDCGPNKGTVIEIGDEFMLDGMHLQYENSQAAAKSAYIADFKNAANSKSAVVTTPTHSALSSKREFTVSFNNKDYLFMSSSNPSKDGWDIELFCPYTCIDSDGGENSNKAGSVLGDSGTQFAEFKDHCSDNNAGTNPVTKGKYVHEYFCDKYGIVVGRTQPCSDICFSGACVNTSFAGDLVCDGKTEIKKGDTFQLEGKKFVYNSAPSQDPLKWQSHMLVDITSSQPINGNSKWSSYAAWHGNLIGDTTPGVNSKVEFNLTHKPLLVNDYFFGNVSSVASKDWSFTCWVKK